MISPQIAVVFATMNRAATAQRCIDALAAQSHPPQWVIIAENGSTDDTPRLVEGTSQLPFVLEILRLAENYGNAGGIERAMQRAFSLGADAVWILDDDSWPQPEALQALVHEPWNPKLVRHALQIDPQTKKLTWPMWILNNGTWSLAEDLGLLPDAANFPSQHSWTGALIPKTVWQAVGPVDGDLFIRGEDEDYPKRIAQHGFRFEAVRGALLDHPGPKHLARWKFFGRHFFYERELPDWKLYYKVRNQVWLKMKHHGPLQAASMVLVNVMVTFCQESIRRVPLVLRASWDGWRGTLGKWQHHP